MEYKQATECTHVLSENDADINKGESHPSIQFCFSNLTWLKREKSFFFLTQSVPLGSAEKVKQSA